MSFASVTIIIACLLIMGSFSLVAVNINSLIKDLENENEIVAFVDEKCTDSQARALQDKIAAVDNVAWRNLSQGRRHEELHAGL